MSEDRPRPFNVSITNGTGHGPSDEIRPDGYRVNADTTAVGDLTGDGKPEAAVAVFCGPEQSNFGTSEIQVFTDGTRLLARLVLPPNTAADVVWEPLVDRDEFEIKNGELVVGAIYWAPGDAHGTPSIDRALAWRWNGTELKQAD